MPRHINPPNLPRPSSRYSQLVALAGSYKRVVVSPQFGVDRDGILGDGVPEQMARCFDNFLAAIAAAGCEPRDVVRVVCYCTERDRSATFDALREARLGANAPASGYFEVVGLAMSGALAAIEGEAVQENAPQR